MDVGLVQMSELFNRIHLLNWNIPTHISANRHRTQALYGHKKARLL
jgi:hypothetical protein